jgi:hypothetical protein
VRTLFSFIFLFLASRTTAQDVFALSEVYALRPDGSAQELARRDLEPLRARNVHWDGERSLVKLFGARNEEVAVAIAVAREGKEFRVEVEELAGIDRGRIRTSAVGYVRTQKGTLAPDLVLPLDGSAGGLRTFDVPLAVRGLPVAGNGVGCALLEVWIPKDAREELHRGRLGVYEGPKKIASLALELRVLPFTLPDRPSFRLDLLSYGSPLEAFGLDAVLPDGGGGDLRTTEEAIRLEQSVHALCLDHRAYLNVLPYHSQRGAPRYAYPVAGAGAKARIASFDGFDRRFGALLDGRLGKFGQPPAFFTLPFNLNYPHGMWGDPARQLDFTPFKDSVPEGPGKLAALREYEEAWRAVASQYVEHFAAKGWKRTAFEVYFNQKPNPARNRSPWCLDEPVSAADYRGLRYLLQVARWAFAGARKQGVDVRTRIDIGHWECERLRSPSGSPARCYKAKDFNRAGAAKVLGGLIDRWVAGVTHTEGAAHLIPEYAKGSVVFDQYGTAGTDDAALQGHSGDYVGLCWKQSVLGTGGRVMYHAGFGKDLGAIEEECFLYTVGRTADGEFVTDLGGGARSRALAWRGVLPSRRLKLWRRSVNDYDYIAFARKRNRAAAESILAAMVRPGLSQDPKYRDLSRSAGLWFTNNVEDATRARAELAKVASGVDQGLRIEGESPVFAPSGAADKIADE